MRRLRTSVVRLVVLLALVLAAAHAGRRPLAEYAVGLILDSEGLADARFDVAEIGWGEAVVADFALPRAGLSARIVRFTYSPFRLARGSLDEVRIEGLRIDAPADWRERLAPLADRAPLDAGDSGGGLRIAPQRVRLDDARIVLPRPDGGTIAVDGTLVLAGDGSAAELRVGLDLGHTTGSLALKSDGLSAGAAVAVEGGGEADLGRAALSLPLVQPGLTGGRAAFTVAGTVRVPAGPSWPGIPGAAVALAGDLRLTGVTAAGGGTVSADVGWSLEGAERGLSLSLTRPARLELRDLPPEALAALPLLADEAQDTISAVLSAPGPLAAWWVDGSGGTAEVGGTLSLALGAATLEARARARARLDADWRLAAPAGIALDIAAGAAALSGPAGSARLTRLAWSATGTIRPDGTLEASGPLAAEAADLVLSGFVATAASVTGEVRARRAPRGWSLSGSPGLAVAIGGVTVPGRLDLPGPTRLTLDRLELAADTAGRRLELSAAVAGLEGVIAPGGDAVAFAGAGGRVTVALDGAMRGEVRLEGAEITLPGPAVALTGLSARLPLGARADPAPAALTAEMRDTGRRARFTPLAFALEGTRTSDSALLTGTVATVGRGPSLPLAVTADLAARTGEATFGPGRLAFRRKGLQPARLSPLLAMLRDVEGSVRVSGTIAAGAKGPPTTGIALGFEDLSARTAEVDVEGLSGTLRLSSLAPVATAGAQELTARRLVAGVPVDDARARFTLLPRRNGVSIRIHRAAAWIAGGEIALDDARWDTGAAANAVDLRVRDVSLGRLLRDWRIEGVSGTGLLSGVIPVRVEPGGAAIAGGRLDSGEAGVIRVDWGAARETLVAAGKQVKLAVRALEDFRYNTLTVGVDQPPGGELTLAIGLEGANPAVLDGHPFRFNVNLSGQLAPILAAVRDGQRIGAGLLRGGLGPLP